MTIDEFVPLFDGRMSRSAAYEAVRREQVPGVLRLGRRIFLSVPAILAWLDPASPNSSRRDEAGLSPDSESTSTPIRHPRQGEAGRHA